MYLKVMTDRSLLIDVGDEVQYGTTFVDVDPDKPDCDATKLFVGAVDSALREAMVVCMPVGDIRPAVPTDGPGQVWQFTWAWWWVAGHVRMIVTQGQMYLMGPDGRTLERVR